MKKTTLNCILELSKTKVKVRILLLILDKIEDRSKSKKWMSTSAHERLIAMAIAVHWKQLENWKIKWNNGFQTMDRRKTDRTVMSERKEANEMGPKVDLGYWL